MSRRTASFAQPDLPPGFELEKQSPSELPQGFQMDDADPVADAGGQFVRGINRGLNSLVALPGRIAGGAADLAGFPETAEKLRWNNAASRFMSSPDVQPQTTAGRYANAAGSAIGASAVPTGALVANSARLASMAPRSTMGAVAQDVGRRVSAAPGAAIAADVTAATGGAAGSQAAKEAGYSPGIQAVTGLAGALAPTVAAGGVASIMRPLRRAKLEQGQSGAYGNVANSVDGGSEALARNVALGHAEGGTGALARARALRVLGEEMQTSNGNATLALPAAANRIARETGVTVETAQSHLNRLRQLHADNPLMLGEQPSVAQADNALRGPSGGLRRPGNVDVEQLKRVADSATREKFDYLASSGNAPSAVQTRNALATRHDTLADNLRGALSRIQKSADSQGRRLDITDADNLIEDARQAGARAYEAAYNAPINNRVMLEVLPRLLARYERAAAGRAGDVREVMERAVRQFYTPSDNGPVAMMSLRQLQDARSRLREMRDTYRDNGEHSLARPLSQFYRRITALMKGMSTQWGQANRQWADMSLDRIGRDLGDAFSKTPGPKFRRQLQQFRQLDPQAQDIVRVHFVQNMLDGLARAKDTHNIAKLYTSDHVRNAVRSLFGDRATVDFVRAVRNIEAAEKTFQMNSRTHIRGQVKQQEEAYQNIEAARRSWSVGGLRDFLIEKASQVLTERRNRPMADILTTPMQNVPRVAMQLQRMRQQEARLRGLAQPRLQQLPLSGATGVQVGRQKDR